MDVAAPDEAVVVDLEVGGYVGGFSFGEPVEAALVVFAAGFHAPFEPHVPVAALVDVGIAVGRAVAALDAGW